MTASREPGGRAPGPTGDAILGSIRELRRKGPLRFYTDAWHRHGDLFRARFGPIVVHVLLHPSSVQHVLATKYRNYERKVGFENLKPFLGNGLLTSEDPLWRKQRRFLQPHFAPNAVQRHAETIRTAVDTLVRRWDQAIARRHPIDVAHEMLRLTLAVIGRTTLGIDLVGDAQRVGDAFEFVLRFAAERALNPVQLPLLVPTANHLKFRRAVRTLHGIIDRMIAARRHSGTGDCMVEALDGGGESDAPMSDRQLRDEVITAIAAGYDTTSLTLSWTWYLLAGHPDVQARLHDELDGVAGGEPVGPQHLERLPYLRAVLAESMRLYPVLWAVPRNAKRDDAIGGYDIPAGSLVLLLPYLTHRHPDFWQHPNVFRPERFLTEQSRRLVPGSYLPFGVGPRQCIGQHLADLELKLAVASLAQSFRVELMPGQHVVLDATDLLRPKGGLPLRVQRRRPPDRA